MIAYLTQAQNPENEFLPSECPWSSWFYVEGDPLPEGAIVVSDEEFAALQAQYQEQILIAKDRITMRKRSEVKDALIGKIASDNKARIRSGLWTVAQLTALTQDPQLKLIMDDIGLLSFELAQMKIIAFNHELITPDIKNEWLNLLQENLYL